MSCTRLNQKYETFNVTYASGVSSADVNFTHYERYGKVVRISAPLALSSGTTKAKHDTIFTIPSGFRPRAKSYFQALNGGSVKNYGVSLQGEFYAETEAWSGGVLWLDLCYICE